MDVPQNTAPTDRERGGRSLFVGIVRRVAEIRGVEPSELPPMGEQIDLDALDRVFVDQSASAGEARGTLSFTYAECEVRVNADGTVEVEPLPGEPGEFE